MFKINPYRPGAGLKPMYIAGRDEDIESVEQIFEALTMNVPVQSIIYSGLRGVGKTVLINKLEEIFYTFRAIHSIISIYLKERDKYDKYNYYNRT